MTIGSPPNENGRVGAGNIAIGLLAGISFWPMDALIDTAFFYEKSFLEEFTNPSEIEVYFRLLVGSLLAFVGVIGSYAAREKKTLETLAISEERWQFALEGSGDGVWDWDILSDTIFHSRRCSEMLGYDEHELGRHGQDWARLIHPEDAERAGKELLAYVEGEIPIYLTEYRVRCKNGNYRWILSRGKISSRSKDGMALRMVGTYSDITERRQTRERLAEALDGSIHVVGKTLEARDPYTATHMRHVARLASAIASEMGLSQEEIEGVYMGASIHDLGKIQVPSDILSRASELSETEYNLVKSHAQVGYDILKGIHFPWPVADIAHQHHERLDGSGYPQGLNGEEICLEARIVAVADIVEAMSSHRPYRASLGLKQALAEIEAGRGSTLDAKAVDACLSLYRENRFDFEQWRPSTSTRQRAIPDPGLHPLSARKE